MLKNTAAAYGQFAIVLHWLTAALVIGLFSLGLYMTALTYYHPWYHSAPWWHKSFGLLLFGLLLLRIAWALYNVKPSPIASHARWERHLASATHRLLYLLLVLICVSGYLISTAKGEGVEFFGWLVLPALLPGFANQADIAGAAHYYMALAMIGLVILHTAGALKHHIFDRDETVRRMLCKRRRASHIRGEKA